MRPERVFIMLWVFAGGLAMSSGTAAGGIIVPAIASESNTNVYSTATTDMLINNSGMTPAVDGGDSLNAALQAVHVYGGVFESWVTNASAPDYFAGFGATSPPVIVWDLTGGGDTTVGTLIIWQYQNDGGNGINVGNHARTMELQFNTEAEGSAIFDGPVTTVIAKPAMIPPGINSAQPFRLPGESARYVRMRITDNHYGDPDGLGVNPTVGGDRVGLGEVRFASEVYLTEEEYSKALDPQVQQDESSEPSYVDVTLSWATGLVYDPADPNAAIADPAIVKHTIYISDGSLTDPNVYFLDEIDATGDRAYYGPIALLRSRTYYWRIDEVTDTNSITGDVWSFVTLASDPRIVSGPADQYVNAGATATFSVDSVNPFTETSDGLSYEWHRVDSAGDTIVGGNASSYTTPEQTFDNSGDSYYCIVSIVEPDVDAATVSRAAWVVVKQRIAYWPFEGTYENIDDPSGATDGTAVGEPGFAEGLVNAGEALALDGVNDYLTVSNDALAWSPTGSFSVSAWAKVGGSGVYRALISNRHEPPVQGFIVYAQSSNQWGFWTGAGNWTGPGGVPVVSGEWTHVAVTFRPTGRSGDFLVGTSTMYINGRQSVQMVGDLYMPKLAGQSNLFIGAGQNENPANFFFNGLIDDVRIYNYALEHVEVAQLYTDVVGPACVFGNPPFDVSGPEGVPDCVVDLHDFAELAAQWLNHGFFPYRPVQND